MFTLIALFSTSSFANTDVYRPADISDAVWQCAITDAQEMIGGPVVADYIVNDIANWLWSEGYSDCTEMDELLDEGADRFSCLREDAADDLGIPGLGYAGTDRLVDLRAVELYAAGASNCLVWSEDAVLELVNDGKTGRNELIDAILHGYGAGPSHLVLPIAEQAADAILAYRAGDNGYYGATYGWGGWDDERIDSLRELHSIDGVGTEALQGLHDYVRAERQGSGSLVLDFVSTASHEELVEAGLTRTAATNVIDALELEGDFDSVFGEDGHSLDAVSRVGIASIQRLFDASIGG